MRFTETDFFYQQQQADSRWALAFLIALILHLGFGAGLYWMPSLFSTKPIIEEVVSVSLVSLSEAGGDGPRPPAARQAEPAPKPQPVAPPPKPQPDPETRNPLRLLPRLRFPRQNLVAVKPEPLPQPLPAVATPAEPSAPVSLAPAKRKVKKAQDTRLVDEKRVQRQREEEALQEKIAERQKIVEARRREAEAKRKADEKRERERARARREQLLAEQEARDAAAEARQLAQELAATQERINNQNSAFEQAMQQTGSGGRETARSIVGENYVSSVLARIKGVWKLPNTRIWDNQLYANVVITINRQGQLVGIRFDRRSGDPQFDQIVEKTIHRAAPLPPFPTMMRGETVEVGGNFQHA